MAQQKNNQEARHHYGWCYNCNTRGRVGFGVLLLVVGGFFLARDLGWVSSDISFWPVVLVALGLYFIARRSGV